MKLNKLLILPTLALAALPMMALTSCSNQAKWTIGWSDDSAWSNNNPHQGGNSILNKINVYKNGEKYWQLQSTKLVFVSGQVNADKSFVVGYDTINMQIQTSNSIAENTTSHFMENPYKNYYIQAFVVVTSSEISELVNQILWSPVKEVKSITQK